MAEQARRQNRVGLKGTVRSRHPGSKRFPAEILDLSPGGCRVELVQQVAVGDVVWIGLPGLDAIQSNVCWSQGYQAGVAFVTPLHPSVFDLIATRIEQA